MTLTPARRPRQVALVALVSLLALTAGACGGGDDEAATDSTTSSTAVESGGSTTQPAAEPEPADVDACALLDASYLADAVSFEFGAGDWTVEEDPTPGTCSWSNEEQQTTISVEVLDGIDDTLDGLSAGTGTELAEVEVGASTATGVRDTDADRLISLYVPAGADSIVKVTQSPLKVEDDQLVAVAEEAAINFENGAAGGGDGESEVTVPESLESVRFTVQSSDAGIDLELEVTAEEVIDAGNPVTTTIICAGAEPGDGGIFEGVYAVAATDLDRDPGLVNAQVEVNEELDGPGSYTGRFEARDSAGRSVGVEGDVTIDEGLRSGELLGEDDAGNQVAVTWECRPLG